PDDAGGRTRPSRRQPPGRPRVGARPRHAHRGRHAGGGARPPGSRAGVPGRVETGGRGRWSEHGSGPNRSGRAGSRGSGAVSANDPALLELRTVESGYSRHLRVWKGVSLRVEAGTCVAVLGSNGAGKSTMLKTVMGLI